MENKRGKRFLSAVLSFLLILTAIPILPILPKAFAQPSEAAATEPANGQIIPYYEVWLRWNDVSDEDHYIISVRDITNGDNSDPNKLLYSNVWVNKNSTYFVIPTSKLSRGGLYRWSLCSVAADGSKNYTPPRTFRIEHSNTYGIDSHLFKTGYSSASHIDYFIHERTSGYGAILEQGVNAWNGISSKVYLHRDYSDVSKQLGIYEAIPDNIYDFGVAYLNGATNPYLDNEPFKSHTVQYTEIYIYKQNLDNDSYYGSNMTRHRANMSHEVGHALSLAHTNGDNPFCHYPIDYSTEGVLVRHIMNKGSNISDYITTTDRDHLRIKWGA